MTAFTTFILIFALFLAQATCSNIYGCKSHRCEARVRTHAGWVCGKVRRAENHAKYASFRGIPYGMPPVGSRRFKELEPVEPWGEKILLDATEDAPACPHSDIFFGRIPLQIKGMSEDCIYLNLHAPYSCLPKFPFHTYRRGLPILVFIHEGAFQSGSGLTDALGPEFLMTTGKVIVVTFNYRLNVFGFLSMNTPEIPGNQGLKDMLMLLRWVKENAQAFGGDPDNVTLMGNSAGATSAHILSLSKAARGLFKRMVLMSGTAIPSYFTTSPEYAKKMSKMFLRELGINQTDPAVIHKQLTKISLLQIMYANTAVQQRPDIVSFGPVVESKFHGVTGVLYENPLTLIAKGRGREYPMIISFTNNEAAFSRWTLLRKSILYVIKENPTAVVSPRLLYTLPSDKLEEIAKKIDKRYLNGCNTTVDDLLRYFTDMYFKHPALKMAQWRAAGGAAPTFVFQFAYELGFSPIKAGHWLNYKGAAKMDDLACIFRVNSLLDNEIPFSPNHPDVYMRYWMVYLITNFMICSDPTCNNNLLWPPVSTKSLKYNLIEKPMKIHMMEPTPEEKDMVKFFDSFDPELRNITALIEGK